MDWLNFLFVFLISASSVRGQCMLDDPDWDQTLVNLPEIEDTHTGPFKEWIGPHNIERVAISGESSKYVSSKIETDYFALIPTEEFSSFEQHEESRSSDFVLITDLTFTCGGSTKLWSTSQTVSDTNNYVPEFDASEYNFQLPMPFPSGIPLDENWGVEVIVTDYDIKNTRVDFSVAPAGDFIVVYQSGGDTLKKTHKAILKSLKPLMFTGPTEYTLTATDVGNPTQSSTATVKIDIDAQQSYPTNPKFDKPYYNADYSTESETHSVTLQGAISLAADAASATAISHSGDQSANFEVKLGTGNTVDVTLKTNIPDEFIKENPFTVLTITATTTVAKSGETLTGETVVVVKFPFDSTEPTTTACPTPEPCTTVTPEICECPTTVAPTECPTEPPCTTPIPETCPTVTCEPCTTVTCTPVECPTTTVCPTIETTACPTCPMPTECPTTTECPVCPTTTDCPICPTTETPTECPACPTTDAPVECPTTEVPTECPICTTTECPACPTTDAPVECPTTEVPTECPICPTTETPTTCPACPTTIPSTECPTTVCTVCPTTEGPTNTEGPTTEGPATECPVDCSECPSNCPSTQTPPTECPEQTTCLACPEEPTPDPTFTLKFEQSSYEFDIPAVVTDPQTRTVKASATPEEPILYSLRSDITSVPPGVTLEDGILLIQESITVGSYDLIAEAVGQTSGNKATATIRIRVFTEPNCGGDQTEFAVIVKNAVENTAHSELVILEPGTADVWYRLEEQFPLTNPPKFSVDETGTKLGCTELDRETIPSYQVTLRLEKKGATTKNNRKSWKTVAQEEAEDLCLPISDILNYPDKTVVFVKVDDDNDNAPTFGSEKIVVGYPHKELIDVIAPPYLVKVQATDKDLGVNAEIRYQSSSSSFHVNPITGVVYPVEASYESGVTFEITAVDEIGNGLKSDPLEVQVHTLTKDKIATIIMPNVQLDDLDQALAALSDDIDYTLKYLSATLMADPTTRTEKRSTKETPHNLRVFAYGLDSQDLPVQNTVLVEEIQGASELEVDTLQTFLEEVYSCNFSAGDSTKAEECNFGGYIAAVVVLCILLVILIVAAILFYYFKLRKSKARFDYPVEDIKETKQEEPKISYDREPHSLKTRRPTTYVNEVPPSDHEDEDENEEEKHEKSKRRSTGFNFNPPPIEDDDDSDGDENNVPEVIYNNVEEERNIVFSNIDEATGLPPDMKDKGRSVTFNENVQNIDIEDDDDDDLSDEDNASKKDDSDVTHI